MKKIIVPKYPWSSTPSPESTVEVQGYVTGSISYDEPVHSLQEMFGRLIQRLADKGLLTAPEVQIIVEGFEPTQQARYDN